MVYWSASMCRQCMHADGCGPCAWLGKIQSSACITLCTGCFMGSPAVRQGNNAALSVRDMEASTTCLLGDSETPCA